MGLHDFGENRALDAAFVDMGTFYVALLTAAPADSATGSTIVEPTAAQYSGYARIASTSADWAAAAGGSKSNSAQKTFAVSAGGASSPVIVTHFALCTAASGGNVFASGQLQGGGRSIASGRTPRFPAGTLVASFD